MPGNMVAEASPRGILQPRDVNQQTSGHSGDEIIIPKKGVNNNGCDKSQFIGNSSEDLFKEIQNFRIAEGVTEELAGMGIREWSVDDFEYISKLGSGASATVYRAKEKTSGFQVALKVQEYDEQEVSNMAEVELDIHFDLDHQNVVRMIDYFFSDIPFGADEDRGNYQDETTKQYFYMILELCEKGSLFDVIQSYEGGWLDECDAAILFRGCLEAMYYLHTKDLVHCDVKTANFLVDGDDRVKLADFGMAVRSNELEVLGGSPVFMAPEHLQAWRNGGKDFDFRVDIYGLGVTLFQMLVGNFPYYIIENDEDDKAADSLEAVFGNLTLGDGPIGFDPLRLDLRDLNGAPCEMPLVLPPISFPDSMTEEACDLISRLMEPDREKRISLSDALDHEWFSCQF